MRTTILFVLPAMMLISITQVQAERCAAVRDACVAQAATWGGNGNLCRDAFNVAQATGFFTTARYAYVKVSRTCTPDGRAASPARRTAHRNRGKSGL
jgi:hypothetical protein